MTAPRTCPFCQYCAGISYAISNVTTCSITKIKLLTPETHTCAKWQISGYGRMYEAGQERARLEQARAEREKRRAEAPVQLGLFE
jgi:hypothetical protein